jgi:hypothetical protein
MEDITRLLREHDVPAASFLMEGNVCDLRIATKDRQHHLDIISDWGRIEEKDSDIVYRFQNLWKEDRQKQIAEIERHVNEDEATRLIKSHEQKAADVFRQHGLDEVYIYEREDRYNIFIRADLGDETWNSIRHKIDSLENEKYYLLFEKNGVKNPKEMIEASVRLV